MTDQLARLTAALADRYRIERELGTVGWRRSTSVIDLSTPEARTTSSW